MFVKLIDQLRFAPKLMIFTCLLVAFATAAISVGSYFLTRNAITEAERAKLEAVARVQADRVANLLTVVDRDLRLTAQARSTINALRSFKAAFATYESPVDTLQSTYIDDNPHPLGKKDHLVSAETGTPYDAVHERFHPEFDRLQDAMGYYDVFLFDVAGNLIYSVFKERDFATNMETGEWLDTDLAEVFRRANVLEPGDLPVFEDFAPYRPSADAPAAFLAQPVFDIDGTRLGVLAYQMPIDALNAVINGVSVIGVSGEAFIVGHDGLLRTDTPKSDVNDILVTEVAHPSIDAALKGEVGHLRYTSHVGLDAMGVAVPVSFHGTDWAVVVHQATDEVLAALPEAMRMQILGGLALFITAAVLAYFLARTLSTPMNWLTSAVHAIMQKDFDSCVAGQSRGDEIGSIARALDGFRLELAAADATARDAAYKGAAFAASGAAMILTDNEFNVMQHNSAMTRLLEHRSKDFARVVKVFQPSDIGHLNMLDFPALPGEVRDAMRCPENLPVRTKVAIGNAYFGLFVDFVRDKEDEQIGHVLEWRDETYAMQTQSMMDALNSNQAIVRISLTGDIQVTNEVFCAAIGETEDTVLGKDAFATISIDGEDPSPELWAGVKDGATKLARFRTRLGKQERIIEGSLSAVPDHTGAPNGFLLVGVDVSEARAQIEAAEALHRAMVEEQKRVVEALRVNLDKLANGDLGVTIDQSFSGDYEQLRADFNGAVDRLAELIVNFRKVAENVHESASEVNEAASGLARRTEEQAAALEETAAALNEVTTSVNSTASTTASTEDAVLKTRTVAENGGVTVREVIAVMDHIAEASAKVTRIIGIVDDIAFQTNLLALNAGVEAARAGESGRGFSVVATEVRMLAQRASEAAQEISTLVAQSDEKVAAGVDLVHVAGDALGRIVAGVSEAGQLVGGINHATREQATALQEVNLSVASFGQGTQQNAALAEETLALSASLNASANHLKTMISAFSTHSLTTPETAKISMAS